jgi:hypothetical protein
MMHKGQVVLREAGQKDGKKLFMVIGVLALDEDTDLKGEHQYTVAGTDEGLSILAHGDDLRDCLRGRNANDILTSRIWRI